MNTWELTEQYAQRTESNSQWLKLSGDGDTAVVVFLGGPYPREVVFDGGGYQPFTDEHKAKGLKPTVRYPINVAVLPEFDVKVFEIGAGLIRDVLKVKNKYGLESWAFELTRHGAAKDPKTTYAVLPERALTADEQRRCAALEFHDLAQLYDGRGVATTNEAKPIDDATAQELVGRLRAIPREKVDEWLYEMKISRARELTTDKLAEARKLLQQLAPAKQPATDPFDGL